MKSIIDHRNRRRSAIDNRLSAIIDTPLPLTLKINRVRPLVISSKCTKFDCPSWNGSVCIVFTSFVDRRTDRQTPAPYHNTSRQVGRIKTCMAYIKLVCTNLNYRVLGTSTMAIFLSNSLYAPIASDEYHASFHLYGPSWPYDRITPSRLSSRWFTCVLCPGLYR